MSSVPTQSGASFMSVRNFRDVAATRCDQPVSFPSLSAAARRRCTPKGRKKSFCRSSSRVQMSLTGWFTACATSTASATKSFASRRPKPPPERGSSMSMARRGMPVIALIRREAPPGLCNDAISFTRLPIDMNRGARRLHGGVREERHLVVGLDLFRGTGPGGFHVAIAAAFLNSFVARHRRAAARFKIPGGIRRPRSRRPLYLQRLAALHRRPGVVRHHRDARREVARERAIRRRRDSAHRADAANLLRGRVVERTQRAFEVRAPGDHRVQHARDLRVDAVASLARDDVRAIRRLRGFADDAEIRRLLELERAERQWPFRRVLRERSVGGGAAVGVRDDRIARFQGLRVDFPELGRRLRLTTGGSARPPGAAPSSHRECWCCRPRPEGHTAPELVRLLARDAVAKLPHLDLLPAHVELFGDEHGQRGDHALADLAAARADFDAVVGVDADEHAQWEEARVGTLVASGAREIWHCDRGQQAAAAQEADLEELAPRVRHGGVFKHR